MTAVMTNKRFVRALALAPILLVSACAPVATSLHPPGSATPNSTAKIDPSMPQARLVAPDPDDPSAITLPSTIRKVTVYSDRALVTRRGAAVLENEPKVYVFKQLPGWVDDSSVRVSASAGQILDVRVSRRYLAHATEQGYQKAEAESRALSSKLTALDDELKVLDAQNKQIEGMQAFSTDKLNKDIVMGNVGVPTYSAVFDFVGKSLRETARGRRAVAAEREELTPQVEASRHRLDDLRALTQLEETQVFVTVAGTPKSTAELSLSYALPGATWETAHELRTLESDPSSVEITSFAVVTQASGENWDDAELTFSTRSTSAAVRIPELEALTLGDTRAATETIERQSASFTRAEEAFKGQNKLWNSRVQRELGRDFEQMYQTNFDYLQVVQSKTIELFQSLQQRGTTAQFKALSPAKVWGDGRSVRVPIGRVQLKAQPSIVAAPEQSLNAALTLQLKNESGQPLLPGNVGLYQGGAFLGMTNLDFIADGEQFGLFMNVADQLKLSRVLDKKHSAVVRKQRTQMKLAFVDTVENLSSKPVTLQLADRIPVSEDRDISVTGVRIGPDSKPDSKGILRWTLTLQPKEKRTFDIQYQLEYPPTLVVELNREKKVEAARPAARPSAAAPEPYDLKKSIQRFEEAL